MILIGQHSISWQWDEFSPNFDKTHFQDLKQAAIEHAEEDMRHGLTHGRLVWNYGEDTAKGSWKLVSKQSKRNVL